jgi:hypothetical protein
MNSIILPLVLLSASPTVEAYHEMVHFDLGDASWLASRRPGAPSDLLQVRLTVPIRMRAVKDEVVAFQLLVKGEGTHPIRVATSSLAVDVFREVGVRIEQPSKTAHVHGLGPGLYPDPLVPTSTIALEGGHGVVWVDVHVPRELQAGLHKSEIRVGETAIPIEIDVLDLELPKRDIAKLGAVNFGSILARGERDRASELAWMQLGHAHHLSIEMLRPRPPTLPTGAIHWESWAEQVEPYVDGSAFTAHYGYRGPRRGQPTSRFVLPHTDWWPVPKTEDGLPTDEAAWSRALAEWEQFAKRRGWFELKNATEWVLFVNSLDEPKRPEQIRSLLAYEKLIADAKLEERARVLFRVDGNFGQPIEGWSDQRMAEELGNVVDLWNVHGAPYTIPWSLLERRRKMYGEKVSVYCSNTSGEPALPPTALDSPVAGLRAWGWIAVRYRLDGMLNWEVDYTDGCVRNPTCAPGGLNLDGTLIYRGHEVGAEWDRPIPSIRLKMLRRGAQDAGLWARLEETDAETARQLAEVMIPRALGDEIPNEGFGAWPQDPVVYEKARAAMLDRLAKVEAPLPLANVRFEKPSQFEGKGAQILFRALILLLVVAAWILISRRRRER